MAISRKHYRTDFKVKVALEALKETKTLNELASEFEVHPAQISRWKKQLLNCDFQFFCTVRTQERLKNRKKLMQNSSSKLDD